MPKFQLMKNLSVRNKISLIIVSIIIFFGISIFICIYYLLGNSLRHNLKDKGKCIARSLSSRCIDPILTDNIVELKSNIDMEKFVDDEVEYLFIIKNEEVLVHTFYEGFPVELLQVNVIDSKKQSDIVPLLFGGKEVYDIAYPIQVSENMLGIIRVGMNLQNVNSNLGNVLSTVVLITMIMAFISTMIGFGLTNIIVKPIRILQESVKKIADGDFEHRVDIDSKNELGYLADSFNKMTLAINARENELRKEKNRFFMLLDNIPVLVKALDANKKYIVWNKECEKVSGFSKEEILNKPLDEVSKYLFSNPDYFIELLTNRENTDNFKDHEIIIKTKDGNEKITRWFNISKHIQVPGILLWAVGLDITDRKKAQEEVNHSREQLRTLAAHMQKSLERERAFIAREVHDELGQLLTAIMIDLTWLIEKLPNDEQLLNKTKSMSDLIDTTIKSVQRISTSLRPEILDVLGLSSAIEWEAERFQNRTGIYCDVKIYPEEIILDKDISISIFRIFQETLTNVARHAHASKIYTTLKKDNNKLFLQVSDNGKGITEEDQYNIKSVGIMGIKERIKSLNGTVNIEGEKNIGTKIEIFVPILENEND